MKRLIDVSKRHPFNFRCYYFLYEHTNEKFIFSSQFYNLHFVAYADAVTLNHNIHFDLIKYCPTCLMRMCCTILFFSISRLVKDYFSFFSHQLTSLKISISNFRFIPYIIMVCKQSAQHSSFPAREMTSTIYTSACA